MKKLIFTFLISSVITLTLPAQDTTMVEQYCNLIVSRKIFSDKFNIIVDFGDEDFKWRKENRLKDEQTGKPKEFNSVIDALNYVGNQGWTLINAFPMSYGGTTDSQPGTSIFHYYFKKLFKRSEID